MDSTGIALVSIEDDGRVEIFVDDEQEIERSRIVVRPGKAIFNVVVTHLKGLDIAQDLL